MRAAAMFVDGLGFFPERIRCELRGSLAATGRGHGTPGAVLAGLRRWDPAIADPDAVRALAERGGPADAAVHDGLALATTIEGRSVEVEWVFSPFASREGHPNAMVLTAWGGSASEERTYFSVGGGFVIVEGASPPVTGPVRHPFATASELLEICARHGLSIWEVALANEDSLSPGACEHLDSVWAAMRDSVLAGLEVQGDLPGTLKVPRRAAALRARLETAPLDGDVATDWLQVFAIAVSEQNACGGRVVTAPTNGAAGIIPAVLEYLIRGLGGRAISHEEVRRFLLTAAAVGSLLKTNGSISGAEAGCQGEVGSASAMAAAGMCQVWGGTPAQVENAAEIALEHQLGLTCDPVGGLVQIPCIERNSIAAATAVRAARTALYGDGRHKVSLDAAIETMRQIGVDMSTKYKETSTGGLAVNVVEC